MSNFKTPLAIAAAAVLGAGLMSLRPSVTPVQAHAAKQHTIATVSLPLLLEAVMSSDAYLPARIELENEYRAAANTIGAELQMISGELQAMQQELMGMDQQSPDFMIALTAFQGKQQEYQDKQADVEEMALGLSKLAASQIIEARAQIDEAAQKVAAAHGFAYVINTGTESAYYDKDLIERTQQQVLSGAVLLAPTGADITDAVLTELSVERPQVPAVEATPETEVEAEVEAEETTDAE